MRCGVCVMWGVGCGVRGVRWGWCGVWVGVMWGGVRRGVGHNGVEWGWGWPPPGSEDQLCEEAVPRSVQVHHGVHLGHRREDRSGLWVSLCLKISGPQQRMFLILCKGKSNKQLPQRQHHVPMGPQVTVCSVVGCAFTGSAVTTCEPDGIPQKPNTYQEHPVRI